ncbi:structure-specific endonuclease subunit slx1-like [Phragmites australis]|uniref:structure-specific endonuclease subunit slx1-like n=1 Tax=Phragmites australis TaxID=29695 RepID=UPI002D771C6A|nr:structure-specific endonuclease subunit slx1-like [Phragmites australis]
MARRTAAKGTRRPRKPSPSAAAAAGGGAENVPLPPAKGQVSDGGGGGGFFCCYLLRSLCPRSKGRTYIGFTVNPRRRLRQHNGEIRSGAWKTRRGRPWEMLLCIHGFTSNVAALQFEWAWQHPTESLAVRKAASSFKSLGGVGNKVKLAYTMLNLPSWENLNLTVNFFSSKNNKFTAGCPSLPSHMKTVVCPMEDLQCYVEGPSSSEEDNINDDPQGHQEPDAPHGDEHTEHSWQQITSELQPMDEQIRNAEDDMDSVGDFAPMEWGGVLGTTELDWSRTSPQCSLSPGDDHGGIAVDNEPGQVSPLLMFGAGSDDGDGHLFHDRDVVNLVTPTPVGRLRRRDCVARICPKIIDLTASPVVIQL